MVLLVANEIPDELKLRIINKWLSRAKTRINSGNEGVDIKSIENYVWSKLSDDRAIEFMEKTRMFYPDIYPRVLEIFHSLLQKGFVKELDGYTVLNILRRIGLDIKPEIRIKFVKDGKEVDLREYLKNDK